MILILAVWFIFLSWLITLVFTLYGLARQTPLLPTEEIATTNEATLVSVLVPARNEEDRVLTECIHSLLAQDYERFEVIAVDDRSTDATGAMLDALARTDERLRVIKGQELPDGWLGKPYAMHQAMYHARGEWILATDADMIFDRAALSTAVSHARKNQADALTLIPRFEAESFWERVMIPTWLWVFLLFSVFYRVSNPKSQGAAGFGGFILMRRDVLERAGGYQALRDEVMEDVRLAELLKRTGARVLIESAPNLVSTRMYRNFSEMWECSTKNWFSGMKFSLPFALSCVVSMYFFAVAPPFITLVSLIGLVAGAHQRLLPVVIPAALSWFIQIVVLALVSKHVGVSPAYALSAPLGLGVLYAMLFDSSIKITSGKGVTWKGRRIYERNGVRPPSVSGGAV